MAEAVKGEGAVNKFDQYNFTVRVQLGMASFARSWPPTLHYGRNYILFAVIDVNCNYFEGGR